MDNRELLSIAHEFGTPCFVFDEEALAARMHQVQQILGDSVGLCYSIKANPFLIPAMRGLVGTLEVCSPGELEICHALCVDPSSILFSGVNKTRTDIDRAMELGVTRFTAESLLHVRLLNEAACARGRVYPVLLRLTAGSQFGMDRDDLLAVIDGRTQYPGLDIQGIHYFSGTQRKKLDSQRSELTMLRDLLHTLRQKHGFVARCVEYGPGLYHPYFANEDFSDTLAPLRQLADDLRALAAQCGLTIEMGRFFASPCGTYLTTAVDVKVNCGVQYAIVDGGMHHVNYLGGNMGMRLPVLSHLRPSASNGLPDAQAATDCVLCGSLCTTADVLVRRAPLADISPGDVIAFHNIGAYSVTEGPALFLSRDLPRIVMRDARGCHLVRDTLHASDINRPLL